MITPHYTLSNLANLSVNSAYYQHEQSKQLNIRQKAQKTAALSLGMQAGLAAQSKYINSILKKHSKTLDNIFNFNLVMYKDNVLPPVIEKANNLLSVNNNSDSIRIGGAVYNIVQQVKFTTTPVTWRDYLWMAYNPPELPNKALLPQNSTEQTRWRKNTVTGWNEGIDQALTIFKINLNRLNRDFNGMILYKILLSKNMISPFYVAKKFNGITGNTKHMVIDDQTWHIANKPQLQIHSHLWRPVLINNG